MIRFFAPAICAALLLACNASDGNPKLAQAPFATLTDSIRRSPKDAGLFYRRGQLLYQNNEPALAKADIREAWKLAPREDIALSLLTVLRSESNDSAFVFLREARQHFPQSLPLAIGLARAYQAKGQPDAALELCDNILKVFPGQLDALSLKAELLAQEGREAESLGVREQAYALAPTDAELAHSLAFSYAQSGNAKVLPLTDSLLAHDPAGTHAEPYYFKGLYYETKGEALSALHWFDEAIRHDYTFLDAYMDKGQVLYEQKRFADALQTFELARKVKSTYAPAYYWKGRCAEAMGNRAEAKTEYERAAALDKTDTAAKAAVLRVSR